MIGARGHAGALFVDRSRGQADHAGDGVGAVHHRARPAHHVDAIELAGAVLLEVERAIDAAELALTVDQHHHVLGAQALHRHRHAGAPAFEPQPGATGQRPGCGGGAGVGDRLAIDHLGDDRPRREAPRGDLVLEHDHLGHGVGGGLGGLELGGFGLGHRGVGAARQRRSQDGDRTPVSTENGVGRARAGHRLW